MELLPVEEIECHLQTHIPHRLNLLLSYSLMQNKLSSIESTYRHNINICMLEISMVAARMFIEFLGQTRHGETGLLKQKRPEHPS